MRCFWSGASGSPNTGSTYYQHFSAGLTYTWNQYENATNGFAGRTVILTEDIIITKFTMWVTTAPGGTASWTFKVRKGAADSSASMSMTGAATTATWTGQLPCSAGDAVCMSATPSNTPANAVNTYWTIEYYTKGNYYLLLSGNNGPSSGTGTYYYSPFGGNALTASTVITDYESVIPTNLTATKISAICDQSTGGTYTYRVRNNTTATDSTFSAAVTTLQAVSGVGSLTFAPGDTIAIKEVRSGSAWANIRCCITIVPSFAGEIVQGYGNKTAPSTSATNYELPLGGGNNAWNATETPVYMRLPASKLQKFYIKATTAPGASKSRIFTLRSNGADTTLTTTLAGTSLSASNMSDSAFHSEGNFASISTTPTGTPTATNGVKIGFVQVIQQNSGNFFAAF